MISVIVDTKEKQPWTFDNDTQNISTKSHKLKTGDYSIEGLEEVLCIERKKSVAEFAQNITQARFENELIRMEQYKYRFIILEFDLRHIDDFPANLPLKVRQKIKITSSYIMRRISEIQIHNQIDVIPCSNRTYAEFVATNIIKRVYEQSNKI